MFVKGTPSCIDTIEDRRKIGAYLASNCIRITHSFAINVMPLTVSASKNFDILRKIKVSVFTNFAAQKICRELSRNLLGRHFFVLRVVVVVFAQVDNKQLTSE